MIYPEKKGTIKGLPTILTYNSLYDPVKPVPSSRIVRIKQGWGEAQRRRRTFYEAVNLTLGEKEI